MSCGRNAHLQNQRVFQEKVHATRKQMGFGWIWAEWADNVAIQILFITPKPNGHMFFSRHLYVFIFACFLLCNEFCCSVIVVKVLFFKRCRI